MGGLKCYGCKFVLDHCVSGYLMNIEKYGVFLLADDNEIMLRVLSLCVAKCQLYYTIIAHYYANILLIYKLTLGTHIYHIFLVF